MLNVKLHFICNINGLQSNILMALKTIALPMCSNYQENDEINIYGDILLTDISYRSFLLKCANWAKVELCQRGTLTMD